MFSSFPVKNIPQEFNNVMFLFSILRMYFKRCRYTPSKKKKKEEEEERGENGKTNGPLTF